MTIIANPDRLTSRKKFRLNNRFGLYLGVAVVIGWLLIAVFADFIATHDPLLQSEGRLSAPNGEHWFGTDQLGRDVFSRVVYAARTSFPLSIALVAAATTVGLTLGLIAGYFGKVIDETIMRIADLVFAFPTIILAMVITAALGPSLTNAVIAMLLVTWPAYARVSRSLVVSLSKQEFVLARRLMGAGSGTIIFREVLPNMIGPVLVLATLDVGTAMLLLSGLSFLGLGALPPSPDWGSMISSGMEHFTAWWLSVFPGLAILTIVLAFNLVGDSMRDQLDARSIRMSGK